MSDDRKSRLAALAAKAGRNVPSATTSTDEDPSSSESKPTISFRNYVPKDANLSASDPANDSDKQVLSSSTSQSLPASKRIKADPGENSPKSALELALAKTSQESRQAAGQVDISSGSGWSTVTPVSSKKINWDLKRDIAHKMEKLERRTQKAIVELLRERLEREAADNAGEDDDSDLD
ncbi:hypothetical protein HJC23_006423 [Cyclotella cryptica]|uniref:Coiled-coil domain-containing protein 12 n=1 Tax=Cyclotella cryptica TaxID=29204 RepID=A0ABD3QUQ8_9STRA|eukprot:CCRYP_001825-RA/>CCRYP_001825-RA protein AED:0.00 eAED:0.00 QI:83/-1/1/1/-1/1/1/189/178